MTHALLGGHRQARVQGDPWQQGGLIVLLPSGEVAFNQVYENAAGRPDIDGALQALRQAASRSARKRSASG